MHHTSSMQLNAAKLMVKIQTIVHRNKDIRKHLTATQVSNGEMTIWSTIFVSNNIITTATEYNYKCYPLNR